MTQGVWLIDGEGELIRPRTKKELRAAISTDPARVIIEATSIFGGEHDGPADEIPEGRTAYIVGPDPYRARNWYATLDRKGDRVRVG